MDYSNDKDPWDWHREDFLQKSFNYEISQGLWNEIPENEDLSYVFNDETTPVKACGDFAYNFNNSVSSNIEKEPDKCLKTSYQIKRRRMLQFNTQDGDSSLSNEHVCSAYLKVKGKEDSNGGIFPELPQWVSGAPGSASASSYEDLESAEGWLADCFNDTEMQLCPDDLNFSGADDVHIDVTELCNLPPACEQNLIQHNVSCTPTNIVFKGGKSFIETPSKLVSSVAYPFAFIKPSGAHGDVTLKEINQRILSPSPLKNKQSVGDPSSYPKSAFSGKPVVGKTKIHIEGGKGSITIMRTKG